LSLRTANMGSPHSYEILRSTLQTRRGTTSH
jgi:hypothetical protein